MLALKSSQISSICRSRAFSIGHRFTPIGENTTSPSSVRLPFINTLCMDEIVFVYLYLRQITFPIRFFLYLSFRGFISIGNGVFIVVFLFYEQYFKMKRSITNETMELILIEL